MSGPASKPTLKDLTDAPPEPRPPRVKPIRTVADVDAISYFDDEEREIARTTMLRRIELYNNPPTIGVACAMHDPKGANAKFKYGEAINALMDNYDMNRHTVPGTLLNLLIVSVMRHVGDEFLVGALAAGHGKVAPGFKHHHYMLMDYPESEVWNAEQRLMIRYAKGFLNNDVTDELWDEAVKTWGVKMSLRYIQFAGHFWATGVRNRTLRVPYPMSRDARVS